MKKAIGLYGRADVGKTETLNLLIDLLEVTTTGCEMAKPMPKGHDRKKAFVYKNMKIGVGTRGDNRAEVEANCKFFHSEKCEVVFTATRTKGGSCDAFNEYCSDNNFMLTWVKKEFVRDDEVASYNLKLAQDLLNQII